jgi:hypothetical protein
MSEVPVGPAAKAAGVSVEVLRELCSARRVPTRRGERGHWHPEARGHALPRP